MHVGWMAGWLDGWGSVPGGCRAFFLWRALGCSNAKVGGMECDFSLSNPPYRIGTCRVARSLPIHPPPIHPSIHPFQARSQPPMSLFPCMSSRFPRQAPCGLAQGRAGQKILHGFAKADETKCRPARPHGMAGRQTRRGERDETTLAVPLNGIARRLRARYGGLLESPIIPPRHVVQVGIVSGWAPGRMLPGMRGFDKRRHGGQAHMAWLMEPWRGRDSRCGAAAGRFLQCDLRVEISYMRRLACCLDQPHPPSHASTPLGMDSVDDSSNGRSPSPRCTEYNHSSGLSSRGQGTSTSTDPHPRIICPPR
jgi:hypothetical protein